jgi:ubiquinone/menaquinone biosynthesis C-methylase UbiE
LVQSIKLFALPAKLERVNLGEQVKLNHPQLGESCDEFILSGHHNKLSILPTMKEVEEYWEAYAKGLEVAGEAWGSQRFFAAIQSEHGKAYAQANQILNLNRVRGRSLLELGCGIGLDTVEFARHGASVTALDLSPACVDLARRLLSYHSLEANLMISNAEDLPYPSDSFDFIVARGLLMYTENDSNVMNEIWRILKPGGEANVLLHNRYSWYAVLAKIAGTKLYSEPHDPPVNRLYSIQEVTTMLAKFSSYKIFFDRFPAITKKRQGVVASLYNRVFVPLFNVLPKRPLRHTGFYIIAHAVK